MVYYRIAKIDSHNTMPSLDHLLDFVRFTHLAHHVERVAHVPGQKQRGTLIEHSYQLALVAWYIVETEKLKLDLSLVLKYAIVHDLVEVYAGDTPIYDKVARTTKKEREEKAYEKIVAKFPDFTSLRTLLDSYEKRQNPESRFVYALDKLVDPLNTYLDGGKLWQEEKVTLDMLLDYKSGKVAIDPIVQKYYEQLVEQLKANETTLFLSKNEGV